MNITAGKGILWANQVGKCFHCKVNSKDKDQISRPHSGKKNEPSVTGKQVRGVGAEDRRRGWGPHNFRTNRRSLKGSFSPALWLTESRNLGKLNESIIKFTLHKAPSGGSKDSTSAQGNGKTGSPQMSHTKSAEPWEVAWRTDRQEGEDIRC